MSIKLSNEQAIEKALVRCRQRATAYLQSVQMESPDGLFWRHSATHDPATDPDHLLYGTWSGSMATVLIDPLYFSEAQRDQIQQGLNRFQNNDGTFVMPNVSADDRRGHDEEYFAFHCTNYALGALELIDRSPSSDLKFVERFSSKSALSQWMDGLDWNNPWKEGNSVVNLASFFAYLAEHKQCSWAVQRLEDMVHWHDRNQNPATGFWHTDQRSSKQRLVNLMAGAAHNLHLYYYVDRDVPRAQQIVDLCVGLGYLGIRSACIDIDMVDILVHFRRFDYRVEEIDDILSRYLVELLQIQNHDGGFCDSYVTSHLMYGHTTPRGISVTWTTWFRLATIGMIASALIADQADRWRFRDTMGMGYFNADYACCRDTKFGRVTMTPLRELSLSMQRQGRFARQRVSSSIRTLSRK